MDKKHTISDSELEVLKELWEVPSLTARQLTDRLLRRTDWSEPTIKTLLLRLLQKDAVKRTIITGIYNFLNENPQFSPQNVVITNPEQKVSFDFEGENYTISLTRHRKPK